LWIIFILIGLAKLNLDWTTGQMGFRLIAFQIPGAGISKMGLYAPWILSVSVPLGAILFLIWKLQRTTDPNADNTDPEVRPLSPAAPSETPDEPSI
jgi:hypothetical protein